MGPLRCHTPDTWLSRGRPDGYVTHPAVAAYRGCVTVQETVNATPGWANSSYVNTTERCTDYPYMPEWDEPYFANSTLDFAGKLAGGGGGAAAGGAGGRGLPSSS